ncbi:MAG TPA: CAP domain-containing protein [Azospirillaceae bacterium]|nr:CAP domain-containing protein [Azospirillaceae bacterium]
MRRMVRNLVRSLAFCLALVPVPGIGQQPPRQAADYAALVEEVRQRPGPERAFAARVERDILRLTNEERRRHGLSDLAWDDMLADTARAHARDMLRRRYFAHGTPEGLSPHDRITGANRSLVLASTAENLYGAEGPWREAVSDLAVEAVQGWMDSPGHRANILKPDLSHLGVGMALDGDRVNIAQNFADVAGRLAVPVPVRVRRGERIRIVPGDMREAAGSRPVGFSFVRDAPDAALARPSPFGTVPVEVGPGAFRIAIYVPDGRRRFKVLAGPYLLVQ